MSLSCVYCPTFGRPQPNQASRSLPWSHKKSKHQPHCDACHSRLMKVQKLSPEVLPHLGVEQPPQQQQQPQQPQQPQQAQPGSYEIGGMLSQRASPYHIFAPTLGQFSPNGSVGGTISGGGGLGGGSSSAQWWGSYGWGVVPSPYQQQQVLRQQQQRFTTNIHSKQQQTLQMICLHRHRQNQWHRTKQWSEATA